MNPCELRADTFFPPFLFFDFLKSCTTFATLAGTLYSTANKKSEYGKSEKIARLGLAFVVWAPAGS